MAFSLNPALPLACFIMISGAIRDDSDVINSDSRDIGIAHQALGDHCSSLVLKSEPRNEEPHLCKCKSYGQKVWCPGKGLAIADRKFDPKSVHVACPAGNAYCAKKESKASRWEMTLNEGNDITAVSNKQDLHSHKDGVFIKDVHSDEDGVFIKTHVQDEAQKNQQKAKPAAKQTTTVPATRTAPTMAEPTTTSTTEDPSKVWVVMAPRFWASTDWKCCEHSQGAEEPKIVYIRDTQNLPNVRKGCGKLRTATGCGCMFGDHWHNIDHEKSPGKCRVTLANVMGVTGWPIEEFRNYRQN